MGGGPPPKGAPSKGSTENRKDCAGKVGDGPGREREREKEKEGEKEGESERKSESEREREGDVAKSKCT